MCGRTIIRRCLLAYLKANRFQAEYLNLGTVKSSCNLGPGTYLPCFYLDNKKLKIEGFYWGLKSKKTDYLIFNSRSDNLQFYSFYKSLQRCVVMVSGYYEWLLDTKRPFYFRRKKKDKNGLNDQIKEEVKEEVKDQNSSKIKAELSKEDPKKLLKDETKNTTEEAPNNQNESKKSVKKLDDETKDKNQKEPQKEKEEPNIQKVDLKESEKVNEQIESKKSSEEKEIPEEEQGEDDILFLAGLFKPEEKEVTIVTTDAIESIAYIHGRMPVILKDFNEAQEYLNGKDFAERKLEDDFLEFYEVVDLVNKYSNDTEDNLKPQGSINYNRNKNYYIQNYFKPQKSELEEKLEKEGEGKEPKKKEDDNISAITGTTINTIANKDPKFDPKANAENLRKNVWRKQIRKDGRVKADTDFAEMAREAKKQGCLDEFMEFL